MTVARPVSSRNSHNFQAGKLKEKEKQNENKMEKITLG